jgi:hypothetical protein
MVDLHAIGFEKEELFSKVLGECVTKHPSFKSSTLKKIVSHFAPEFLEGLFDDRPVKRQLKYMGPEHCVAAPEKCEMNPFFEVGNIYHAVFYNGGSYVVEGYDGRIGSGYFDVVQE